MWLSFLENLSSLKSRIFKKLKPKTVNGHVLNGPMLLDLAQSYVDTINNGKVPTIETAWDYVCMAEAEKGV